MKKVLITGGPVYGKLDDVKIVSNKFKGGLIARLADEIVEIFRTRGEEEADITYLTAKTSVLPVNKNGITILYHDGVFDYQKKVLELAPQMDAVILGAAVANLIPKEPYPGKFPSHNYKPGDVINVPFTIAPRIIDQVKSVAPNTVLFGFKLLSGVPHEELVRVAYDVVLESRATAIFANDTTDLSKKYAVTKERSEIPLDVSEYADFIVDAITDTYYRTEFCGPRPIPTHALNEFIEYEQLFADMFKESFDGRFLFGTIAVRTKEGFLTTTRGKRELEEIVQVLGVYEDRVVAVANDKKKATLNAPLLDHIFKTLPEAYTVVHYHQQEPELVTLPYAFPGTVRDSKRDIRGSFNIAHHGAFLLFDKDGNQL